MDKMQSPDSSIRQHRLKNYWDVTYDPNIKLEDFIKWSFVQLIENGQNNSGPRKVAIDLTLEELKDRSEDPNNKYFKGYVFTECDVFGNNNGIRVTFKDCQFKKVCFGYATFKNIKFVDCKFVECSFSMASFESCQFNNCDFKKISYSGNETQFINTRIESGKFIHALYVNQDRDTCEQKNTTPEYQLFRSYGTKTKCSKVILNSLTTVPEDDLYYRAVEVHSKCKQQAKKKNHIYSLKTAGLVKKIGYCFLLIKVVIENFIINTSGLINGWGGSLFRCVSVGLSIMLGFTIIYALMSGSGFIASFMKSIDITLLTGYTKYSLYKPCNEILEPYEIIHMINMVIGIWWYGILIPTLINKICISRS